MTEEIETRVYRVWYAYRGEDFIDVEAVDGGEAENVAHGRTDIDEVLNVEELRR